ncbi:hypothetical protein PSHT_10400 [Puccinia striiformis]|uniref:Uncharacterized protein n=3 Tax=Puccinia striiformis TaxID=27350 RepID=A0A2S4UM17_9BASI|nr:hypothetical protein PSTT_14453 [Puccinia striiformis]POW06315.1 hypothetical protein PSHT_10400 [Puccinia striiformis]
MQTNYNTNGGAGQQPQQQYQSQHPAHQDPGRTAYQPSLEHRQYHGFDQNLNFPGHQPPLQHIVDIAPQQRQHTTPAIPTSNGYLNPDPRSAIVCQGPRPTDDIHQHVPAPHSQPRTLSLANLIGRPPNTSQPTPHPPALLASPSSTHPNSISISGDLAPDSGMGSGASRISRLSTLRAQGKVLGPTPKNLIIFLG